MKKFLFGCGGVVVVLITGERRTWRVWLLPPLFLVWANLHGSFALGAVLYWAVERPFLRLRDRLEGPSRSSLAVEAAVRGALDR